MGDAIDQPRFVWPPRPTAEPPSPSNLRQAPPPGPVPADPAPAFLPRSTFPLRASRSPLAEVERHWLGLVTPPLPDRIAEAGWNPDDSIQYCPRCGTTTGPSEASAAGCPTCRTARLPWDRLIRLGEFDGVLREIVHDVKFTRWRRLGHDLGHLLGSAVGEQLVSAGIPPSHAVVVPIGCSWLRRMSRGIDHALVIARGVSQALDLPLIPALSRAHRPTQTDLPRGQRRANVSGSFSLRRSTASLLQGKTIILVDDVTTTRATIAAASRQLRQQLKPAPQDAGPADTRIWAAVVAVTPDSLQKRRKIEGTAVFEKDRAEAAG